MRQTTYNNLIPNDPKGFNTFLEYHVPKDNGCPLARYVLDGVVPTDKITCTKHCPFPECFYDDNQYRRPKWTQALRNGFVAGLEYYKLLSESK